jgi:isopentenyl-diphosphate delta-isomerase
VIARTVLAIDRFTRIHFVGYSAMWALLGAASVDAERPLSFWLGLGTVGALFHLYGGVLNDVFDLPIDRTQPARAADPLVRGTISRGQALVFALIQLPLGLLLTAGLGGGATAVGWFAAAAVTMGLYNAFGKRCPLPPLTDGAQGLAWACMTLYGATLAGGDVNALTGAIAASGVVYTLLINGVHGGMRDLENDLAHGAHTAALWLGMRPRPGGGIEVPRRAGLFCWPLTAGLLALAGFGLGAGGSVPPALLAGFVLLCAACLWGMRRVLRPDLPGWDAIFRVHLIVLLFPLLLAVCARLPGALSAGILLYFLGPMALLELQRRMLPSGEDDLLITVNEEDEPLGPAPRGECHDGGGILHRAFSVYLFDEAGRVLLQRRSAAKRLWPLFWSNSVCSHPRWGEQLDDAAHRRVREELGVEVGLQRVFRFVYQAAFEDSGSEHEACSVYVGRLAQPVEADEREIAELRFASAQEVDAALAREAEAYTPWFRIGWQRLRDEHWEEVGARSVRAHWEEARAVER